MNTYGIKSLINNINHLQTSFKIINDINKFFIQYKMQT